MNLYQIAENFTHLEAKMWLTLIGLLVLFIILKVNLPQLLKMSFAFETNQQVRREQKARQERLNQVQEHETESSSTNPGLIDINPQSHPIKNSFWREIQGKSLGLVILLCGAVLRFVIQAYPKDIEYSLMWQTHAIFAVLIFFSWLLGLIRRSNLLGDVLVTGFCWLWCYYLFR
ncbi:MAG: hypothetical protein QG628_998 [Patescibacteria group bacterium]|nr:hypothetical protein [Patescibacteria group bacterium]